MLPRSTGFPASDTRCYDTRVRISVIALILITVSHFGVAEEPAWETVEEVLAVVGSTPILLSDVELSALVRLADVEPDEAEPDEAGASPDDG